MLSLLSYYKYGAHYSPVMTSHSHSKQRRDFLRWKSTSFVDSLGNKTYLKQIIVHVANNNDVTCANSVHLQRALLPGQHNQAKIFHRDYKPQNEDCHSTKVEFI